MIEKLSVLPIIIVPKEETKKLNKANKLKILKKNFSDYFEFNKPIIVDSKSLLRRKKKYIRYRYSDYPHSKVCMEKIKPDLDSITKKFGVVIEKISSKEFGIRIENSYNIIEPGKDDIEKAARLYVLIKKLLKKINGTKSRIISCEDLKNHCRNTIKIKVKDARKFINNTFGNHHILTYKDNIEIIERFNRICGIETILI